MSIKSQVPANFAKLRLWTTLLLGLLLVIGENPVLAQKADGLYLTPNLGNSSFAMNDAPALILDQGGHGLPDQLSGLNIGFGSKIEMLPSLSFVLEQNIGIGYRYEPMGEPVDGSPLEFQTSSSFQKNLGFGFFLHNGNGMGLALTTGFNRFKYTADYRSRDRVVMPSAKTLMWSCDSAYLTARFELPLSDESSLTLQYTHFETVDSKYKSSENSFGFSGAKSPELRNSVSLSWWKKIDTRAHLAPLFMGVLTFL